MNRGLGSPGAHDKAPSADCPIIAGMVGRFRSRTSLRGTPASAPEQVQPTSALRPRTQNSLPSGSASTTQPCSPWPTSTLVAPNVSSRSTSSSRLQPTGLTSRCNRFFAVLFSGTRAKTRRRSANDAPDSDIQRTSPFSWTSHPRTALQNSATRRGSLQSKFTSRSAAPSERRDAMSRRPACPQMPKLDATKELARVSFVRPGLGDPLPLSRLGRHLALCPRSPSAYRGLSRSRYQWLTTVGNHSSSLPG